MKMVMVVMLAVALSSLSLGCKTTPGGDRKVDRASCFEAIEAAKVLVSACEQIKGTSEEDEWNRARCRSGADIALAGAKIGCSFADDIE